MLNCLSQAIITFVYFILPQVLILGCFFFFFNSLVAIKDKIAFVINAVKYLMERFNIQNSVR